MKFSKTAWSILGIGIIILVVASLYMLYLQEGREQERLNEALATAQSTLPKLASERANLEGTLTEMEDKLAEAKSLLEKAKANFPASVESIEYDEQLFGIAKDWGLEITILTASEAGDETVPVEVETEAEVEAIEVEAITYFVTSFSVEVKGEAPESASQTEEEYKAYIDKAVDDILNFINTIVTHEDFTTATVELVNITVPGPLTEEEKEGLTEEQIKEREEIEVPSATINLIIYGYQGE